MRIIRDLTSEFKGQMYTYEILLLVGAGCKAIDSFKVLEPWEISGLAG